MDLAEDDWRLRLSDYSQLSYYHCQLSDYTSTE